jgi:hypothetical protein
METAKKLYWGGWVMTVLPVLMLLMSTYFKLTQSPQAVEGFAKMGFPEGISVKLGIVELVCTVLYLVPQTAVLGAILVTGYLGGAVCVHVRGGEGFAMPVVLGVLVWGGLFLRDPRVRALLPVVRG